MSYFASKKGDNINIELPKLNMKELKAITEKYEKEHPKEYKELVNQLEHAWPKNKDGTMVHLKPIYLQMKHTSPGGQGSSPTQQ